MIIRKSKTGIITVKAENKQDSRHMMKFLVGETNFAKAERETALKKAARNKTDKEASHES